jgi:uncharacterized protein (TIGR00255 family)
MIKSMTGFGQGSAAGNDFKVRAEIRSVNSRFLDIQIRAPQNMARLEIALRKQIQASIKRGRVELMLSVEQLKPVRFQINRPLVSGYLEALDQLKRDFNLEGEPSLDLIAKLPDALIISEDSDNLDESLLAAINAAVSEALTSLDHMRSAEGLQLAIELASRLDRIAERIPQIEAQAARLPAIYREKLTKRIQEIISSGQLDQTRLAQEVVILADRSDISEEIARLRSHISQMRDLIGSGGEVGKRLDFILQEMNREANTILSKSGDLAVSDAAIVIKTEVEKLREQVQNVE